MPAISFNLKTTATRRAQRYDKYARRIITFCGTAVIATMCLIVAMILGVAMPLFRSPRVTSAATCRLPEGWKAEQLRSLSVVMSIDGRRLTAGLWTANGSAAWLDLRSGNLLESQPLRPPQGDGSQTLRQVESLGENKYALLWDDAATLVVEVVEIRNEEAQPSRYAVRTLAELPALKGIKWRQCSLRYPSDGLVVRAVLSAEAIHVFRQGVRETLLGEEERFQHECVLRDKAIPQITALTLADAGDMLYAGTDDGRILCWRFNAEGEVVERDMLRAFADHRSITAMATLLGDVSLVVGDAHGGLSVWTPVSTENSRKLHLAHHLQPHKAAVCRIFSSGRDKSLLSLDIHGVVHVAYATSERRLLSLGEKDPLEMVAWGTRGDIILGLNQAHELTSWKIERRHPEISLKTLFGKVYYEGYDSPAFVWQTTGGDDFEPKYSLVPLLVGTLKGTFYAMLLAGPLALGGAIYVGYFLEPKLRGLLKPVVEIMATLPSVVIGFLAALWLAPLLEKWLLAFLLSLIIIPVMLIGFLVGWQFLRRCDWLRRLELHREFLPAIPVLILGVCVARILAAPLENALFEGNFRQWLYGTLHTQYHQRNAIVVAFGLGFAVISLIFTLAEDAISNAPHELGAASLALGASRWQTLQRVVLPWAAPGIFAAVMIGFGRAVGETMIVLMATGNTPILDWGPFSGMRTLSANIAVEMPEAPVGGTLYRVLFLCAALLFLLTFLVNTTAELVRTRLWKRKA